MAVKFINVRQEGIFQLGDKIYILEIEKKSTAELCNFYKLGDEENEKGLLLCSVYTKYNSRAVGVKKAGSFTREVYGDFSLYINFKDVLGKAGRVSSEGMETSSKLVVDDEGYFINIVERKGKYFYRKQYIKDNNVIEEKLQKIDEDTGKISYSVEYGCVKQGNKVKCKKLKGINYKVRESGDSDVRVYPVKTMEMIELEKDLSWLEEKDYRVINKKEDFEEYLKKIDECDGIIGFDTETTGLKINRFPVGHPERDYLVGICISVEDNEGVYIPVKQKYFDNLDESYVIESLRPYIDRDGEKKKSLATHNGKFDFKVMYTYDIWLNIENDSYILHYMLNNSEFRIDNKLKHLSKEELGMDMVELEDNFMKVGGKKTEMNFAMLPYDNVKAYAPADADATRLLVKKKLKELPDSMRFLYWVEIELMKYLGRMEYYGMRVDVEKVIEQAKVAKEKLKQIEQEIYEMVGKKFNISSTKQLQKILYEDLGYKVISRTKKGAPSTSKLTLQMLSREKTDDGEDKYPLAGKLLEYRKVEQLLGGFLNKMIEENTDGFIFPSYNQTGTNSGRISCSEPNLQQTPGHNREVMVPDSDDYYFVVVDYSQVEYRIMAGLANEVDIIESFKDPDADHHIEMYARMHGIDPDKVTKKQRKIGKVLNFGLTYGMGPRSLALTLYLDDSYESIQEAKKLSDKYWDSVANIRDMLLETKDRAYLYGYTNTKFGRRRYFPEIRSSDYGIRQKNRRRAGNTKVQGTGADILKIAHVKVERKIDELGLDARVKISMHDELVLQVNRNINPWYMIKILRECMELKIKGFPPLFIGACVGDTWAVGKRDDLEVPIRLTMEMFEQEKHLEGAYEDPQKMVEEQIKEYQIREIRRIIEERNLNSIEKALDNPTVDRILSNYFYQYDFKDIVQKIFKGENIQLSNDHVFYNDKDLEFEESSGDVINEVEYDRLKDVDKEDLELESPEVRTAEVLKSDYRIIVHDRKCFIRTDNVKASALYELRDYFEKHGTDNGNNVVIVHKGVPYKTPFYMYDVDKIKLTDILDRHTKGA